MSSFRLEYLARLFSLMPDDFLVAQQTFVFALFRYSYYPVRLVFRYGCTEMFYYWTKGDDKKVYIVTPYRDEKPTAERVLELLRICSELYLEEKNEDFLAEVAWIVGAA